MVHPAFACSAPSEPLAGLHRAAAPARRPPGQQYGQLSRRRPLPDDLAVNREQERIVCLDCDLPRPHMADRRVREVGAALQAGHEARQQGRRLPCSAGTNGI